MLRLRTFNRLAAAVLRTNNYKLHPAGRRSYATIQSSSRNQSTAAAAAAEPFLNGSSSAYVEEMYISWQHDPSSVHKVTTILH